MKEICNDVLQILCIGMSFYKERQVLYKRHLVEPFRTSFEGKRARQVGRALLVCHFFCEAAVDFVAAPFVGLAASACFLSGSGMGSTKVKEIPGRGVQPSPAQNAWS